jgi:hypothetical protein
MSLYSPALPDTLEVCGSCYELRGAFVYKAGELYSLVQACRCDREARPPGQLVERWPVFDYNTVAELCRGCGAIALQSGSRWSVWFCRECQTRAVTLNRAVGRPVLPIGRHSLMHGISLSGPAATTEVAQASFLQQCGGLFDQQERLRDWAREVVRRNLIDLHLDGRPTVPLPEYSFAALSVNREQRFNEMLAWFAEAT